jgi:hypothetical protein
MSKFLLNLLMQISKCLVYSKIQFLFEKKFSSTFGPIGPVASRPIRPFLPRAARQAEPTPQAVPRRFPFLPPSPSRQRRRLLSRRRRAMDAAPPSSAPWSCNGRPPLTPPRPPHPPPDHKKGYPHSRGAPPPFTSPPSLHNRARAVAAWS